MRPSKPFTLVIILLIASVSAFAQGASSLTRKANAAYRTKDYVESARLYLMAIDEGDTSAYTIYSGACALALIGRKDEAFNLLDRLIASASFSVEQFTSDADLQSLRADARWAKLIPRIAEKEKRLNRFWNNSAWNAPFAPNLSDDAKVDGLSRFWSEVKFNFANFDLVPELDWDALYLEYLPKVRATKTTLDYYQTLAEMCAKLKDGHTNIIEPKELADQLYGRPAVSVRLIENRPVLWLVFDKTLAADGLTPGLEIVAVDGMPVRDYAAKFIAPYQSASTPQDRDSRTFNTTLLGGPVGKAVELTLHDASGKEFKKTLPRLSVQARNDLAPDIPPTEFKVLTGNIGYIALNQFEDKAALKGFEAAFDDIAKTDGLIIDIRDNGGGDSGNGYRILSYLTDQKTFATSKWRTRG